MANPNIRTASAMYGKNVKGAITVTLTALLSNGVASGNTFKVNSIHIANIDGTASANITASIYNGATDIYIASLIPVPARNAIQLLDKPIYLMEGESVRVQASADGDLHCIISYEEIVT